MFAIVCSEDNIEFINTNLSYLLTLYHFYTVVQETMDHFYKGESEASRGTLSQLKTFFGHRSLKTNVMENVQHVVDMVDVSTVFIVISAPA